MPRILETIHIQHLYNRAGFGIVPKDLKELSRKERKTIVKELFDTSTQLQELKVPTPQIDAFLANPPYDKKSGEFKKLVKISRKKHLDFNKAWIQRMAATQEPLKERMVLFWANHFVVRSRNIVYTQKFNNTLRKYCLGNFREFLIAMSQEPAMLEYLNNQQNRKASPNENFARELMELFTLGEGQYSEKDVQESARAFTGWSHNFKGDFVLRKRQHDFDEKVFLGKKGTFDGTHIIDIILEQPECAQFIAKKVYAYFVNDVMDEKRIDEIATVFGRSYDIAEMMRHIFLSDWFYGSDNIGTKIKSPTDLLVGLKRIVPFQMEKLPQLVYINKLLGQFLMQPPNVAGWPKGRNWIDANTMMVRLKLPSVLLKNGSIAFDIQGEFEDDFQKFNRQQNLNRNIIVTKRWDVFQENYGNLSYQELASHLIVCKMNRGTEEFVNSLTKGNKQEFCIQLMSLPEFQLC